MLKTTPFNLFKTRTINAFLKTEPNNHLLLTGRSLGIWRLAYLVFQVDAETRAIMIPTYKVGVCFYDQSKSTATGEIPIDDILERAESEHTRLFNEGRLPDKPEPPRRKEIRFPVGEYQEITNPHQTHRFTFYEAKIPIAGTNTQPLKIVSWALWNYTEQTDGVDSLLKYGIGLPKHEIGQVAWLCCRDEKPIEQDKTLIVYENGSADLIITEDNRLTFPPRSFTISKSQRYRFQYPKETTTTQ